MTQLTTLERRIGDLDHPWYDDERARLVSYEVYSVVFQALFYTTSLVATAGVWLAPTQGAYWALGFFVLTALAMFYTGVRLDKLVGVERKRGKVNVRGILWLILYVWMLTGLATRDELWGGHGDFFDGARGGLVPGAIGGSVATLLFAWWKTRKERRTRVNPADVPDED